MNIKGAIFDLDGTLVNSLEDLADSMNHILLTHHFPNHSVEAYKNFLGKGIMNLVRVSLPETVRDDRTIKNVYDQMVALYREHCTVQTRPYAGITSLIEEMKSRNLKLCILSNKADEFTQKIVRRLLPDCFEIVAGLSTEEEKKPNPKVALDMCKKLRTAPGQMLFIGDSGIDMQTALSAGMVGVGVLWGFREREELVKNGAKIIISYPMDLINHL
ncbi:MAG: HAD family hydrolase [Candidatus Marinimicrobia bacterium]|nr:HAD family hydrolase [Candidatus Neomarinimicrobiota bacterium]